MKKELYRWLRAQQLSPKGKFILQKLCDHANDNTFEAGVRVSDLAQDTGHCERGIQTGLRQLEADEHIVDTGRTKRLRSGGTPRIYRIAPVLPTSGAKPAPQAASRFHPSGCSSVHPCKESEKSLSKERGGSDGPESSIPASIRQHFVDYLGESFATAYLDRCEWSGSDRTLVPHSPHAYERIRFEGGRLLKEFKITVLKRNG